MNSRARWWQRLVDHDRGGRRVVEKEQDLGKQTMSPAQIDDASASKEAADPASHFPRLEQLLARQAARVANGAGQPMKESAVRKAREIPIGETSARRG